MPDTNIQIAALRGTSFAEAGQMTQLGADCTFFWSGYKQEEQREVGFGSAIQSYLFSKFAGSDTDLNNRDDTETPSY